MLRVARCRLLSLCEQILLLSRYKRAKFHGCSSQFARILDRQQPDSAGQLHDRRLNVLPRPENPIGPQRAARSDDAGLDLIFVARFDDDRNQPRAGKEYRRSGGMRLRQQVALGVIARFETICNL